MSENTIASTTTSIAVREPQMTRESTSVDCTVVPNQCVPSGAACFGKRTPSARDLVEPVGRDQRGEDREDEEEDDDHDAGDEDPGARERRVPSRSAALTSGAFRSFNSVPHPGVDEGVDEVDDQRDAGRRPARRS